MLTPLNFPYELKAQHFACDFYRRGSLTERLKHLQEVYGGDMPVDTGDILERTVRSVEQSEDMIHQSLRPDLCKEPPIYNLGEYTWFNLYTEDLMELITHIKTPSIVQRKDCPCWESFRYDLITVIKPIMGKSAYELWFQRHVYSDWEIVELFK